MQAEVLLDAVIAFTDVPENFNGQPPGTRAIALPDPTIGSRILETFGRPLRNNACDLAQALHLINDYGLNAKIRDPNGRLSRLLKDAADDRAIVEELYLAGLSRLPTDDERQAVAELVADVPNRDEAWQDIMWTLLNCSEFAFNH